MNSTYLHTQSWAPGTCEGHSSFSDVQRLMEDHSHLFDEMIQGWEAAAEPRTQVHTQPKAKVLFQFFDGWPMTES